MSTRTYTQAAALLAAALAPCLVFAQTSQSDASGSAIAVTEAGTGLIVWPDGIKPDGTNLVIESDRKDAIGLTIAANAMMPTYGTAELTDPDSFVEYALHARLTGEGGVGVRLDEGFTLRLGRSAEVSAETAVSGKGTLAFVHYEPETSQTVHLTGALDMREGSIVNGNRVESYLYDGADVHYAGIGELGRYSAYAGSLTVGEAAGERADSFLRIGTLEMNAGANLTVDGTPMADASYAGDRSVLVVGELKSLKDETGGQALASLTVKGEGALVLGTPLAGIEESDTLRERVYALVTDSALVGDNARRATLVTAADPQLGKDFSVVVGSGAAQQTAAQAGIHVGSDGRWVVYFDDADKKNVTDATVSLAQAAGLTETAVSAEEGAELILYNWNGQSFTIGDFDADKVHAVGGARLQVQDGVASRLWCADFAGLKGSAVVSRVERDEQTALLKALPGYRFIYDTFDERAVSADAYANVIDGALFLPVTSGLAAASERVAYDALGAVMEHDASLFADKGHWWVQAGTGRTDASDFFSGGSGDFGYKADVAGGTLGYDFGLGKRWIASAAVSFAGIDTQSRGRIEATTGDMTTATLTLAAVRALENGQLRLALSYTRASGEAEQHSVGHTLEADTDIDYVSAAARWTGGWNAPALSVAPYVQAALTGARMDGAAIEDRSGDGAVSGKAFETDAKNRVWATLEAGADAGGRFALTQQLSVRPTIGAALRASVGQTDWEIRSALFDGSAQSEASYDSAQRFAARVRAGVELASSGYDKPSRSLWSWGKKSEDEEVKEEPFAWKLVLSGLYEAASGGEESASVSLQFRQLF